MKLFLHQTHHAVGDFKGVFETLKNNQSQGLHVYPELFLTGYPLQDLCLAKSFRQSYEELYDQINQWSLTLEPDEKVGSLIGGLEYQDTMTVGIPKLYNSVFFLTPGEKLRPLYHKKLLPNYDIFDEKKYFAQGGKERTHFFNFQGKLFGLLVCEDMWAGPRHERDPVEEMAEQFQNLDCDGVINLSASPFNLPFKMSKRITRASQVAAKMKAPFMYVNRVGGEDEVLFDGRSFVHNGDEVIHKATEFGPQDLEFELPTYKESTKSLEKSPTTFSGLFEPAVNAKGEMHLWDDQECYLGLKAITFGLQEYAQRNGFERFLVAVSGGIDSALVLALTKLSLSENQSLEAIFMPGLYSSSMSYDLALELCQRLEVPFKNFPIKFLHSTTRNAFREHMGEEIKGLTDENIQSRIRGMLVYARSNQTHALVLNTSNKSELAVGYSTQYGDSVGGISLLGDLYKTEVVHLSQYLNKKFDNLIPQGIIDRPPTAELREDQKDSDSLPPYEVLDPMLELILSNRCTKTDIQERGFSPEQVEKVLKLYTKSEYKRKQFCPILKMKGKSFGFGYRIPVTKKTDFWFD